MTSHRHDRREGLTIACFDLLKNITAKSLRTTPGIFENGTRVIFHISFTLLFAFFRVLLSLTKIKSEI